MSQKERTEEEERKEKDYGRLYSWISMWEKLTMMHKSKDHTVPV